MEAVRGKCGVAVAGTSGGSLSALPSLSAASLMSLVIIFLSFCCLFFAESWIICVYALLLDDSCAVGLQSVFQIRWIMNKPLQQKSYVLYVPCLPSSVPALSWRVSHWGVDRWAVKSLWCRKFSVYTEYLKTVFLYISLSSSKFLESFPVSEPINQCFFSGSFVLEILLSLSGYLSL